MSRELPRPAQAVAPSGRDRAFEQPRARLPASPTSGGEDHGDESLLGVGHAIADEPPVASAGSGGGAATPRGASGADRRVTRPCGATGRATSARRRRAGLRRRPAWRRRAPARYVRGARASASWGGPSDILALWPTDHTEDFLALDLVPRRGLQGGALGARPPAGPTLFDDLDQLVQLVALVVAGQVPASSFARCTTAPRSGVPATVMPRPRRNSRSPSCRRSRRERSTVFLFTPRDGGQQILARRANAQPGLASPSAIARRIRRDLLVEIGEGRLVYSLRHLCIGPSNTAGSIGLRKKLRATSPPHLDHIARAIPSRMGSSTPCRGADRGGEATGAAATARERRGRDAS